MPYNLSFQRNADAPAEFRVMVKGMNKLIFIILLIFSSPALAGDYTLTVSDDSNCSCAERVKKMHEQCTSQRKKGIDCHIEKSWPLKTSDEVIESIKAYFAGKKPSIKILLPAFSNGHLEFCSSKEKIKIYEALLEIKKKGNYKHGRHIDDFIHILGTGHNKTINPTGR
jgi:hypothetical protein